MSSSVLAISGSRHKPRAKCRPGLRQSASSPSTSLLSSVPSPLSLLFVAVCLLTLNPGGALCKRKFVPLHLIRQARCAGPDCDKLSDDGQSSSSESRSMASGGGMMQLPEMQFYSKSSQVFTMRPKVFSYRPTRLRSHFMGSPIDHKNYGRLNSSRNQEGVSAGKFINGHEIPGQKIINRNGILPPNQFEVRQGSIPIDEYSDKDEASDIEVELPEEEKEVVVKPTPQSSTQPPIPTLSPFETIEPTKDVPKQSGESVTVGRPTSTKARPFGQQGLDVETIVEDVLVQEPIQEVSPIVQEYDLTYPGPPFNPNFGSKPTSGEDYLAEVERVSSPGADYSAAFTGVNKPEDEENPGSNDLLGDIRNNILQMSVFGLNSAGSGSGLFNFGAKDRGNLTDSEQVLEELSAAKQEPEVVASLNQSTPEEDVEVEPQVIYDYDNIDDLIIDDVSDNYEEVNQAQSQENTEAVYEIIGPSSSKEKYELSGVMKWYYDNMPKDLLSQIEANLPSKETNDENESLISTNMVPEITSDSISNPQFPTLFGGTSTLAATTNLLQGAAANRDGTTESNSCPSQCMCVCPGNGDSPPNQGYGPKNEALVSVVTEPGLEASVPTAKINLGISMYPCSRSAAYQLNLAMKLCKRKRLLHSEK